MTTAFFRCHLAAAASLLLALSLPLPAKAAAPGFVRVEQRAGRWRFVADGKPFLSLGVDNVNFAQDKIRGTDRSPYGEASQKKYGSKAAWQQAAARRLLDLGFNSLGAWSDDAVGAAAGGGKTLYTAPILDLGSEFVGRHQGQDAWLGGIFPDVFDPAFAASCRDAAARKCAARRNDTQILGWFSDNELCWGPDWRSRDELLVRFLNGPENAPGRKVAAELLRGRYPDVAGFNAVWKTSLKSWADLKPPLSNPYPAGQAAQNVSGASGAVGGEEAARKRWREDCVAFQEKLAGEYFRITAEAIRAADPNHLVFGCRFAVNPGAAAIRAAGKHVDVISFNCYDHDPRGLIQTYAAAGRPVLIGEFAFRGDDAGLPNTQGAGPRVPTQKDRAAAFRAYITRALGEPAFIGYHWFEHADEPAEGRFDGENSNYGIVNIRDEPYPDLTAAMKEVNAQSETLHDRSSQ